MLNECLYGVVVSDGYADYLDVSLCHNRAMLDRCVVVTHPSDKESQRVAGKYACELIVTEDGKRAKSGQHPSDVQFNKGAMIERGLQQLPADGWRVHFDADIVFPGNMRQRLGKRLRDKTCIYGVYRINVIGTEKYQQLLAAGFFHRGFEHHHFLSYPVAGCEVGGRLIFEDQLWIPIGFWQAWHSSVEYTGVYRTRTYATGSNSAAHDDVQFGLRFDIEKRILIPDFYVAHLLTEDSKYAANWKGRKTAQFRPFVGSAKGDDRKCDPVSCGE
jgi:hypothetical protein